MSSSENGPLLGREGDLETLRGGLRDGEVRLVSVVGPGGVGKTSLAGALAKRWDGPVWVTLLDTARDESDVVGAIGAHLGAGATRGVAHVVELLREHPDGLLILDNAEQVLDATRLVVEALLAADETPRIVVTSRRRLDTRSEQVLALQPLEVEEAVELFVRQARRRVADFEPEDPAALMELVERLDRLPLAIELAAARVTVATVPQMVERIEAGLDLLSRRGSPTDRHATLDSCIAWSWTLLDDSARAALSQLAVFAGGFRLADAERVVTTEDGWVGDLLEDLTESSLLRTRRDHGAVEFTTLQTVRSWVRTHEPPPFEAYVRIALLYADEFAAERTPRLRRLLPEVAAVFEQIVDDDPKTAARLLIASERAHRRAGLIDRLATMYDALPTERLEEATALELGVCRASMLLSTGEMDKALQLLDRLEPPIRDLELHRLLVRIEETRGYLLLNSNRYAEAEVHLDRARGWLTDESPPGLHAHVLGGLTLVALHRRDLDGAEDLAHEAYRVSQRSENPGDRGRGMTWLANVVAARGELSRSITLLREALRAFRQANDVISLASNAVNLASMLMEVGGEDLGEAIDAADALALASGYPMARLRCRAIRARLERNLDESRAVVASLGPPRNAWLRAVLLSHAVLLLEEGLFEEALPELDRAIAAARRSEDEAEVIYLSRYRVVALLHVGRVDEALALEGDQSLRALLADCVQNNAVPEALDAAYRDSYMHCELGFVPEPATLLARLYATPPAAVGSNEPTLSLSRDGKSVVLPDATAVDLSTRHTLRRFLLFMVQRHEEAPGTELDLDALMQGGWPDQAMTFDSGSQRVYASIKNLRKLGFDDVIATGENGYLIAPTLRIAWRD